MEAISRSSDIRSAAEEIRRISHPLNTANDLDILLEKIGDAKFVLLGEASHGTHEYYTWRTAISKRLIEEKGFSFVAVEGDWPDCYRVNRFVKGYRDAGEKALEVLQSYDRWPTWMWANWEIVAFSEWMREFNKGKKADKRAGFYGLDVYSLWESLEAINKYLEKEDPATHDFAQRALECFEPYGKGEGQEYARATLMVPDTCEDEVVDMLSRIRLKLPEYNTDREAVFSAEQNALVAVNAERYYRAMIRTGASSWNIRDRHMVETLDKLMGFHGNNAKAIVWEHNTHIGDARATDMAEDGMVNVGQLVREEHYKEGVFIVGLGSYEGSVIAGRHWGDVMRKLPVPPAKENSWEDMLRKACPENKIIFSSDMRSHALNSKAVGHRAIGVVYHPEREMYGNYVPTLVPFRYDAFMYIDKTKALHPLHLKPDGHKMPETYPFGY